MAREERDWIDWTEFCFGFIEVCLTVFITWMIWKEVGFGKHQEEIVSRAPKMSLSTDTVSVGIVPLDIRERPIELTDDEAVAINNNGTAALQNGTLVIYADATDAKIPCPPNTPACKAHYEPTSPIKGIDLDLGRIGVRGASHLKFQVSYMSSHKPFKLHFMVGGDNMTPEDIGTIPIDPTLPPPPPKSP
jgi:hypothetical protein